MATKMHRLQISLPHRQARFLEQRARLDGVSMAEVVRRLIDREVESTAPGGAVASLSTIAGIAEDRGSLIDGVAVSENPLYLATPTPRSTPRRRRS